MDCESGERSWPEQEELKSIREVIVQSREE